MKKKSLLVLAGVMLLGVVGCTPVEQHTAHIDNNHDGKCDECGEAVEVVHEDKEHDGFCDVCGAEVEVVHVDADGDEICDVCGTSLAVEPAELVCSFTGEDQGAFMSIDMYDDMNWEMNVTWSADAEAELIATGTSDFGSETSDDDWVLTVVEDVNDLLPEETYVLAWDGENDIYKGTITITRNEVTYVFGVQDEPEAEADLLFTLQGNDFDANAAIVLGFFDDSSWVMLIYPDLTDSSLKTTCAIGTYVSATEDADPTNWTLTMTTEQQIFGTAIPETLVLQHDADSSWIGTIAFDASAYSAYGYKNYTFTFAAEAKIIAIFQAVDEEAAGLLYFYDDASWEFYLVPDKTDVSGARMLAIGTWAVDYTAMTMTLTPTEDPYGVVPNGSYAFTLGADEKWTGSWTVDFSKYGLRLYTLNWVVVG